MSNQTTFLRVWDYIFSAKEFTCLDLQTLGISREHAYFYIKKMLKFGYITHKKEKRVGRAYGKYSLVSDAPKQAPIFSKAGQGQATKKTSPRQKVWTTMRIFCKFTVSDLQIASESSYSACHKYIRDLVKAGYVKVVSTKGGFGGKQYTYQLIQNPGPKALQIYQGAVVDPNANKVTAKV